MKILFTKKKLLWQLEFLQNDILKYYPSAKLREST